MTPPGAPAQRPWCGAGRVWALLTFSFLEPLFLGAQLPNGLLERDAEYLQREAGVAPEDGADSNGRPAVAKDCGARTHRPMPIASSLMRCYWPTLSLQQLLCILEVGQALLTPVLLQQFLLWLEDCQAGTADCVQWRGWLLAAALGVSGVAACSLHHYHSWLGAKAALQMRQQVVAAIHSKALRLTGPSLAAASAEGAVATLISTDVRRLDDSLPLWPYLLAAPLQLMAVLAMVTLELDWVSALAGVATSLALIPLQGLLASRIATLRDKTAQCTDERLMLTEEAVEGALAVKMLGKEGLFLSRIVAVRGRETRYLRQTAFIHAANLALIFCASSIVAFITFSVYRSRSGSLDVSSVFYALSLLQLPTAYLVDWFVDAVQRAAELRVSFQRIDAFLSTPEPPCLPGQAISTRGGPDASDPHGADPHGADPHGPPPVPVGTVRMGGAAYAWPSVQPEGSEGDPYEPAVPLSDARAQAASPDTANKGVLSMHLDGSEPAETETGSHGHSGSMADVLATPVQGGKGGLEGSGGLDATITLVLAEKSGHGEVPAFLGKDAEDSASSATPGTPTVQPALAEVAFALAPGELLCVTGATGSGKTSLLAALMGELPEAAGTGGGSGGEAAVYGSVAYCAQLPWVMAGTARDNILLGLPYDEEWYSRVVQACCLSDDFATWAPDRDALELGDGGTNISGGQRARLALARACYARPSVALLDDPLSAVDPRVARCLFDGVIGPGGLLAEAGATRVLVTHQQRFLAGAVQVLVLRAGRQVALGPWEAVSGLGLPELAGASCHPSSSSHPETAKDANPDAEAPERTPVLAAAQHSSPGKRDEGLKERTDTESEDGGEDVLPRSVFAVPLANRAASFAPAASQPQAEREESGPLGPTLARQRRFRLLLDTGRPTPMHGELELRVRASLVRGFGSTVGSCSIQEFDDADSDEEVPYSSFHRGGRFHGLGSVRYSSALRQSAMARRGSLVHGGSVPVAGPMVRRGTLAHAGSAPLPGSLMRRGMLGAAGSVPAVPGALMRRGTLVVAGSVQLPGALIRRGTLVVAGSVPVPVPTDGPAEAEPQGRHLVVSEDRAEGGVSWGVYGSYGRYLGGVPLLCVLCVGLLGGQALALAADWWLAEWAHASEEEQTDKRWLEVYGALTGAVVAVGFFRAALFFAAAIAASTKIHNSMVGRVLRSPLSFFHTNPTGRILNRFSRDQGIADDLLPPCAFDTLQCACMVLGAFALVAAAVPMVLPVLVLLGAVFYYLRRRYIIASRQMKRWEAITFTPVYATVVSSLKGLPTIRAYRAGPLFEAQLQQHLALHSSWWFALIASQRWMGLRTDVLSSLALAATALLACALQHRISIEILGLALAHTLNLATFMQWFVRQTSEVENSMTNVERMVAYTQLPTEPQEPTQEGGKGAARVRSSLQRRKSLDSAEQGEAGVAATAIGARPADWPRTGALRYENVTAVYRAGLDPVLEGLTFELHPGSSCGVVGRTGSGKSSLVLTLFRLIHVTHGRILLDGVDIASVPLALLRRHLAIIPQDPTLFSGTLRSNLDSQGTHADGRVWEVLRSVGLREAVAAMPGGLDALVACGGVNLSVGQRQQLCLARALLTGSKLLALDEATANVDAATDAAIQATLREFASGGADSSCRVVLTIAHRLETVMGADQLLVLGGGVLLESGPPRALAEAGGAFSRMVEAARQQAEEPEVPEGEA